MLRNRKSLKDGLKSTVIKLKNMAKKKEIIKENVKEIVVEEAISAPLPQSPSEKDRLLALYQTLKDLGIRSISDLENLIARL